MRKRTKWFAAALVAGIAIGVYRAHYHGASETAQLQTDGGAAVTAAAPRLVDVMAPIITARSAIVIDAADGKVLYQRNANVERAPASTTKLMTLYLTFGAIAKHHLSLSNLVPVSPDAARLGGEGGISNAYLRPGDQFTLDQMIRFITVLSANDAAVAVADDLAGSTPQFVREMNQTAHSLGMAHTHFMNPDGLPEANHYASAHDLAVLARALMKQYPQVLAYTDQSSVSVHNLIRPSTDQLLGRYPGLDGLKTGYTQAAGYCFVGTAKRGGHRIIVVVMGDTNTNENQRFADTAALLDYGFARLGVSTG